MKKGLILLIFCKTALQVADIFTKATDKKTFIKMRNKMMNVHGNLRGSLDRSYQASSGAMRRLIRAIGS